MTDAPPGFSRSSRSSPLLDLVGPLFAREQEGRPILAIRARQEVLNARGFLHAAVIMALADVALGRAVAAAAGAEHSAVTASLTVDFLGRVEVGEVVEVEARCSRVGRRMGFAQALLTVADRPVAQASGVFAVTGP